MLTDPSLTRLCRQADVSEGSIKQISLAARGVEVAVYKLDGEYFATDDMCTHAMVSLAEGEVEDGQIFCPLHGGAFDIRTGKATAAPCHIALKIYKVVLVGEDVYIQD